MPEALTLARPYARAAFEVARDAHALDAWSRSLGFAAGVARNPKIAAMRNDPRVGDAALVAMHLPTGEDAGTPFGRLLAQMAAHGRLELLPEVAQLFEAFKRDAEAVLKVSVTTAMACGDAQLAALKAALHQRYRRDIDLATTIDPALIGGAVINVEGEVIDGSARGGLAQLASALEA